MKEKSKTILKTLGVSALALTGLFAFSGCATDITLTQEQADKTIESVQNLDANMQEMIEQNNAQNLKIEELIEQIKNQNEIIEEQSNSTTQNLDANMQEMIEQNNAQNLKIEELVEQIKKQNEIIEKQSNATTREQVVSKLQLATLRLMMNYNDIWDGLQIKLDDGTGSPDYDTYIKSEDGYVRITDYDGNKDVYMNYEKDGTSGVLNIYNTDVTESTPNGVGASFMEDADIRVRIAGSNLSMLINDGMGDRSAKIDEDCVISYEQKEDGTLFVDTFVQFIDYLGQTNKILRRYEISSDSKIVSMELYVMVEYYSNNEETSTTTRVEMLYGGEFDFTYNYEGINKEDYLQIVNDMKANMPTV